MVLKTAARLCEEGERHAHSGDLMKALTLFSILVSTLDQWNSEMKG